MSRSRIGITCVSFSMSLMALLMVNSPARSGDTKTLSYKIKTPSILKIEMYPNIDWSSPKKNVNPAREPYLKPLPVPSFTPRWSSIPPAVSLHQVVHRQETYLTSISTDKPLYRVGETVHVRGVVLQSLDHKPLPQSRFVIANIEIKGSRGESVAHGSVRSQESVWAFEWKVPDSIGGGQYNVHVAYAIADCHTADRNFEIRAFREPRLSSLITFSRNGYGPGERVSAVLNVKRTEGGFPAGAAVSVDARVDGTALSAEPSKVDARGNCTVNFKLPEKISHTEGTLALTIADGGVVETASKTIPILLHTVDLDMYPEGGELIAGFKNRVYVQSLLPNGKPADVVADVVAVSHGNQNNIVSRVHTEHEGRGRFEFIPRANVQYSLKILKPTGISKRFELPPVKAHGAVIRSDRDVYKRDQPITVVVGSTEKKLRIVVAKRDRELTSKELLFSSSEVKAGALKQVAVPVPHDCDGVLVATIYDENRVPLAERLIFREPANPLFIKIKPGKKTYAPGENAEVLIKTVDADNKPISAVVGVSVTDESVLKTIDKRERAPRLPIMVYLEPEVKDLADASVYFDAKNPKAPLAIDLLLGTQGWRRFAFTHVDSFVEKYGDKARRLSSLFDTPILSPIEAFRYQFGNPRSVQARMSNPGTHAVNSVPDINYLRRSPSPTVGDELEPRRPSARWDFAPNVWRKETFPAALSYGSYFDRVSPRNSRAIRPQYQVQAQAQPGDLHIEREFAHHKIGNNSTNRADFADTIYWNSCIKTDAKTGEAKIIFQLSDSITTFQTFADAFTSSGSLADAAAEVRVNRDFYAETKLPLEVSAGDRIMLPISLVNGAERTISDVNVKTTLSSKFKSGPLVKQVREVKAQQRVRYLLPIEVLAGQGEKQIELDAHAGAYHDKLVKSLSVKPSGFPTEQTFAGILEPDKPETFTVKIEKDMVSSSMVSNAMLLTSPLAKLTAALERLIRDPYGCFEQTASTTYPLIMAQQYFLTHPDVNQSLVVRSKEKLDAGYNRLLSFRCSDGGYECFGKGPSDEDLTASALLLFTDMAKVKDVDQVMIEGARNWLLRQKDGSGGFTRKRQSGHVWNDAKDCSNAYIVWALLESGEPSSKLQAELSALKANASASQNNYVVALAANAFELAGDKDTAKTFMARLASQQKGDGSVGGITQSTIGSTGDSLSIEGTALATLAWQREPEYLVNVEKSIRYLHKHCRDGGYGSTQSTVLALRCVIAYDQQHSLIKDSGKARLYADGHPVGDWITLTPNEPKPIKLPDLSELLCAGEHQLELRMEQGNPVPYSIAIKYNRLTPASERDCKLDIAVSLAQSKLVEGKSTEANITVSNRSDTAIPSPIAIIGLPGGLEPRHEQLKDLVKTGKLAAYEVKGREVVFYWRSIASKQSVQIPLSLVASIPGSYTGPASRTYAYYGDEHKKWVPGLHVEIAAK